MTNSTPKKVASTRAKPKSSSRTSKKNRRVTKNSLRQASVNSSQQSLRHISVSNEDKEPECVSSILEVNSNHIMDFSNDEGTMGTIDNPIEMIIDEENENAELHKAYLPRGMIHTELEIRTAVKGMSLSSV